jgi:hypothetical protein
MSIYCSASIAENPMLAVSAFYGRPIMRAVAYNLKKLLKWQSRKIKVMAMAKIKEVKTVLHKLFLLFHPQPTYPML